MSEWGKVSGGGEGWESGGREEWEWGGGGGRESE